MDIARVEIRPVLPGFHQFISNWLIRDDLNLLVDVGPANGGPGLLEDLRALGLDRLDYVLITHIHMDHCGALAQVMERYPTARVICHEKAVPHLQDPGRLWEATQKALGEIGAAYGTPAPVPVERLIPHPEASLKGLGVIETPGHAVHHLSFTYKGALFAGEAGGNYARVGDDEYLRPPTPPKLLLDVFLESVDRLFALDDMPIYYGHFGAGDSSRRLLKEFRDQIGLWRRTISEQMTEDRDGLVERCIDILVETDPHLKGLRHMDADMRKRERYFITNSVKGFIGYLNP
ncbi:MAG: MBL fold metallo-hydrolase [Deltaproteobacteria bacterium]|nr:MBL fold metallo-hydrolase [Deltaproteobacteria bacterium]